MAFSRELLQELTQVPGIAGQEDAMRTVVARHLRDLVDEIHVDTLGNVTGRRGKAGGPSLAIAAHIDEIGFIVRHIDDKGFLRVQRIGGFDPRVLVAQRVLVHPVGHDPLPGVFQPASKPIHLLAGAKPAELSLDDLFIDLGLPASRVQELVKVGTMVTLDRELALVGETVVSKALDDRLGVYVMLEAIRASANRDVEVFAIATVQEEVGLRGARAASHAVDADVVIALDVTIAGDIPGGTPEAAVTRLGEGAGIKLFDGSQIANRKVVQHLTDLASQHDIPFQLEVLPAGGTDAGAFQQSRTGVATCTISIPTRYVHTVNEMANIGDIQACVDLLAAFVDDLGNRDYAYSLT